MRRNRTIAALAVGLLASGCAGSDYGPQETVGGLTGAAIGGLLGSQFGSGTGRAAATGAGVFIGALIGSEIGRDMDRVDRMRADGAIRRSYAAPLGETITWSNPESGNRGSVTPVRDGYSTSGLYCRDFRQTIVIDGEPAQGRGVACRDRDGVWRIVS
ncbi:MAG: RT0821/Lpp0805 family surface protein [Pseudomonadota bacterium]